MKEKLKIIFHIGSCDSDVHASVNVLHTEPGLLSNCSLLHDSIYHLVQQQAIHPQTVDTPARVYQDITACLLILFPFLPAAECRVSQHVVFHYISIPYLRLFARSLTRCRQSMPSHVLMYVRAAVDIKECFWTSFVPRMSSIGHDAIPVHCDHLAWFFQRVAESSWAHMRVLFIPWWKIENEPNQPSAQRRAYSCSSLVNEWTNTEWTWWCEWTEIINYVSINILAAFSNEVWKSSSSIYTVNM